VLSTVRQHDVQREDSPTNFVHAAPPSSPSISPDDSTITQRCSDGFFENEQCRCREDIYNNTLVSLVERGFCRTVFESDGTVVQRGTQTDVYSHDQSFVRVRIVRLEVTDQTGQTYIYEQSIRLNGSGKDDEFTAMLNGDICTGLPGCVDTPTVLDCTASPLVSQVVQPCNKVFFGEDVMANIFLTDGAIQKRCLSGWGRVLTTMALGDPHLVTLDGLEYDCQTHEEFVLLKIFRRQSKPLCQVVVLPWNPVQVQLLQRLFQPWNLQ